MNFEFYFLFNSIYQWFIISLIYFMYSNNFSSCEYVTDYIYEIGITVYEVFQLQEFVLLRENNFQSTWQNIKLCLLSFL